MVMYQCKMIKLFLRIFRRDKRIFRNMFNMFFWPSFLTQNWLTGQVGRPHGRPYQGPVDPAVDRRAQSCARLAAQWAGRPTGRPDQRALLSVSGRSTGLPNGHIYDRWRPTGRPTAGLSGCQISLTASFLFGLYKPQFFGILAKVFTREKLLFP